MTTARGDRDFGRDGDGDRDGDLDRDCNSDGDRDGDRDRGTTTRRRWLCARASVRALSFALLGLALGSCGASPPRVASPSGDSVAWNEWSRDAFERARAENRPILLSVQAGWCHWCHVMNDTTYRDAEVRRRLHEGFVSIRADSDARPDLADRYRRYGWPATIFLSPDGTQLLALRGYRDPAAFRAILARVSQAHADGRALEPDAGPGAPVEGDLEAVREALIAQLDGMYDEAGEGWGRRQRYPLSAPVEHAFFRAALRDEDAWRQRALRSLAQYARLVDPVFGGVYQYSIPDVWDRPHFEKIVPVQAGAMSAFAEAHRVTGDPAWLERAEGVHDYLRAFMRAPDGAFYASQDADLGGHGQPGPHVPGAEYYALDEAGRRALGIPRVDPRVYADTNGRLITALVDLSVASGRPAPLRDAVTAAERMLRTHRGAGGLFVHEAGGDDPLFYLADQAHLLRAFIALHQASGHARWLEHARALAAAIAEHLRRGADQGGGFFAHTEDPRADGFFAERRVPIEDNAIVARALLTLARLDHEPEDDGGEGGGGSWRDLAVSALRACARPDELRRMGRMVGEYLMALESLRASYVVLSVVGPDEPRTEALHRAAVRVYAPTRLVELARPGESRYPYPGEPSVFLCSSAACSMPVTDPSELAAAARAFLAQ